ncbi:MAG: transglycosylase SLT domain-containing protein [Elusimicrobia bacterium]|nr:transglycosylase SLT domain-containing protein [Elusimicrobiota bacterium]
MADIHRRFRRFLTLPFALGLWLAPGIQAGSPGSAFDELDQEAKKAPGQRKGKGSGPKSLFEETMAAYEDRYETLSAGMEAAYQSMERKMAAEQAKLQKQVQGKWTEFHPSTNKEWVEYSPKADSMSKVDFERGEVEVEVLVPVEEVAPAKKERKDIKLDDLDAKEVEKLKSLAEEKIRGQAKSMVTQKEEGKAEVMKDQIKTPDGKPVDEKNVDRFVKETIAPKMQVEDKPVVAQDGKPRMKVKVKIAMAPEHLKVRAQRYSAQVNAYAKKYGLEAALIYAVIHTESYFNPKARSVAGALGLMQLVPRTAGVEAYKYLYKEEKLITPEYLFNPDNNIMLGSTYLHMLHTRHYGKLKNPESRRSLSVAAYNCGPGNVRKTVTSRHDVDNLSGEEVVRLLKSLTPKETQAYVPHVLERMELYRDL